MMKEKIVIGTRGSELAMAQARLVAEALRGKNPGLECEIRAIRTAGDERTDIPLREVNRATNTRDKGVFIAAIEEALAAGEADCAVHSLKDMPGALAEGFEVAAFLPREERWDALVVKPGADMAAPKIGTSSVRRERLIDCYWSGRASTLPIRGNVATRLRKLIDTPEMDATVLARAGLNRLGYGRDEIVVDGVRLCVVDLSKDSFMPALGQGTIAVEIRRGDERVRSLVASANDEETAACARCERAFLELLNADCSVPVAGYATCQGKAILLRALYFTPSGQPIRLTQRGFADRPCEVAQAAYDALQRVLGE